MAAEMKPEDKVFQPKYLAVTVSIMLVLWGIAFVQWFLRGDGLLSLFIAYIGLLVGLGIGMYIALPDRKRPQAQRVVHLMVGSLLLVTAIFSDHGNMQIEGLFFGVLLLAGYIVLHYALAKVVGPLVIGRIWCGWACWFTMIFDFLPYPYSRYRKPGNWGMIRYLHFFGSLALVLVLWFAFDYRDGALGNSGMQWFVIGLALYYMVGIAMAFWLKDNRAFCKYLCPIAVPMKATSRYALLKVTGEPSHCQDCEACVEMCPMNIRIKDYIVLGERVLSTECTLCQTCINICPHDSLKLSLAFDVGGKEYVDWEPPRRRKQ
ncbi:MAG: 4Fe-4S binding protein [Anaerolineae bacterium]|nr:4Fe-4S binding protein [Anaerolineae bacterium]